MVGPIPIASAYLETCLESGTKTDEFCDGVPDSRFSDNYAEEYDEWRAQHFTQLRADIGGLVDTRYDRDVYVFLIKYRKFLSVIQDHCVQRRAKE